MAIASDTYTTGGSQPFCAISPSDLVTIQENWLSRIEALEKAVSALLAQNVSAGQISDISQQIGWVEGVTFMGVPGWTQTEVGTLIPPPGFSLSTSGLTMSDGSVWQAVLVNSDGSLSFGFGLDGNGNGVIGGSSAPLSSYLVCQPANGTITALQPNLSTVLCSAGSAFGTANLGTGKITITETGYYHISVHILAGVIISTGYRRMYVSAVRSEGNIIAQDYKYDNGGTDKSNDGTYTANFGFTAQPGDYIQISFDGVTGIDKPENSIVTIEKLAGA